MTTISASRPSAGTADDPARDDSVNPFFSGPLLMSYFADEVREATVLFEAAFGEPARTAVGAFDDAQSDGVGGDARTPGASDASSATGSAGHVGGCESHRPAKRPGVIDVVPSELVQVAGLDLGAIARVLGDVAVDGDGLFSPAHPDYPEHSAAELSEILAQLDRLKSAIAAMEAQAVTQLDKQMRADDAADGVAPNDRGRAVAHEYAFASRMAPARASRRLRSSQRLVTEMPHVFGALARGTISAETAHTIGRAVAPVPNHRLRDVDAALSHGLPEYASASARDIEHDVALIIHKVDPNGQAKRARRAAAEQNVTFAPAPHSMMRITATVPALDGSAIRRKLSLQAEAARAAGDDRGHAMIMARGFCDTLLSRDDGFDPIRIDLGIVMTERTLLSPEDGDAATIDGYGAAASSPLLDDLLKTWRHDPDKVSVLRRLFTLPTTSELVAVESRGRAFPAALGAMIRMRDQVCRGPFCTAAIRHNDHIVPHSQSGATSFHNGQGLCAFCNRVKESLGVAARLEKNGLVGWRTRLGRGARRRSRPLVADHMQLDRRSGADAGDAHPSDHAPPLDNYRRLENKRRKYREMRRRRTERARDLSDHRRDQLHRAMRDVGEVMYGPDFTFGPGDENASGIGPRGTTATESARGDRPPTAQDAPRDPGDQAPDGSGSSG